MKKLHIMISSEMFILILILILASFLRIWKISEVPYLSPDELEQGIYAIDIMRFGVFRYIASIPFLATPQLGPMIGYVLIPSFYLFGQTIFALRIPNVIISILTIILTYLFAKEVYDKKTALLASFVLSIIPNYIILNRTGYEFALVPFFLILSLFLLSKFDKTKDKKYLYLFSFVCGLGVISRLTFVFFLVSLILTFKINPFFRNIKRCVKIKDLLVIFLLFLLGIYPLVVTQIRANFSNVRNILENFTKVNDRGTNLTDIKTNFLSGILTNLPLFLETPELFRYSILSFFTIFLISLVVISIILIFSIFHKYQNQKQKEDLFLIINLFIIITLTSTLTLSEFKKQDYITIVPLVSIIISRAFFEFSKNISKSKHIFYLLLIIFILILSYNIFKLFIFIEIEKSSVNGTNELTEYLIKTNHNIIVIDDQLLVHQLKWNLYKRKIYERKILSYRSFLNDQLYIPIRNCSEFMNINLNNITYMFTTPPRPHVEKGLFENFLNMTNHCNKTFMVEEVIYTRIGMKDRNVTIYRIL